MSFAEDRQEHWQTTRPTIKERSKFMFNNDRLSDVRFVVPTADGESKSKKVIPAHKFVLSISSPVFEAMFYGELAETKDSIELPDCEYKSLLELFRFMYSDEVNLSGSNVMGVLYLAKKYMVPSPIVSKFQRCCRFDSVDFVAPGLSYSLERRDCLLFEVTRDKILCGLILCGRKNERYP